MCHTSALWAPARIGIVILSSYSLSPHPVAVVEMAVKQMDFDEAICMHLILVDNSTQCRMPTHLARSSSDAAQRGLSQSRSGKPGFIGLRDVWSVKFTLVAPARLELASSAGLAV